jgi:hypothetical protein
MAMLPVNQSMSIVMQLPFGMLLCEGPGGWGGGKNLANASQQKVLRKFCEKF